jgi:cobalt/nickel transport system ATP-binding protein/energy-coupling factor transport system ATP-binding protein
VIEPKEVNFAYRRGEPVINDIDCRIDDGEFIALLGHNGSGKTTLSRLFMALMHPRSGAVYLDGEDIAKKEPADLADRIGFVFQNPDLQILADTVWDEVAYGPRNKKLPAEQVSAQVEEALAATGLTDFAEVYPRTLSFGQKRRLGVAAALALKPRILILDEITNGQDSLEKEQMMNYLRAINEKRGITVILITHDMNIARLYARRVLVLHNGSLVFDDVPEELFNGIKDLGEWGLEQPTMAALSRAFGLYALTVGDFCSQLVLKAGEQQ